MSRWIRPQVVVAALLLAFALVLGAVLRRSAPLEVPRIQLEAPPGTVQERRVDLVYRLPGDDGELGDEIRDTVSIDVTDGEEARSAQVVAALRTRLVQEGVWPEALAAPRVFRVDRARGTAWVIELVGDAVGGVTVAQERALAGSLEATARANGASEVAFVTASDDTGTLLGRVAVPFELESRP